MIKLAAALTLLAGCSPSPAPAPGPSAPRSEGPPVRIMPLGDSITEGQDVPGGYRTELYRELTESGARFDFVGSQHGGAPDPDHEGHRGFLIGEVDAHADEWVRAASPRVVLLLLGANDVILDQDMAAAPGRLATLIDHILAAAPGADILVGTLPPQADPARDARVGTFNAALPGVVQAKGAHVHYVDLHGALTVADLSDGVHPTADGYARLAHAWATVLRPVLSRVAAG